MNNSTVLTGRLKASLLLALGFVILTSGQLPAQERVAVELKGREKVRAILEDFLMKPEVNIEAIDPNGPTELYAVLTKQLLAEGELSVGALVFWLDDERVDNRGKAAKLLGFVGHPRAVKPLVSKFADASPLVRKEAVVALGRIGSAKPIDASSIDELTKIASKDGDDTVRSSARAALEMIRKAAAKPQEMKR
jgi:hypothetical protein